MISPLDKLSVASARRFGGKAVGLARLREAGAPIPETLCISIETSNLERESSDDALLDAIATWLSGVSGCSTFIVRSSHFNEDSLASSNAGIYASRLINIDAGEGASMLLDGIHDLSLKALQKEAHNPSSAFLIQPYKNGIISGVLFTSDPNIGLHDEGVVTVVDGPCSTLVDGSMQPTMIMFSGGAYSAELPSQSTLQLNELLTYCRTVEKNWRVPIDVEFTIDVCGALFLLQARPIAALTKWQGKQQPLLVHIDASLPPPVLTHPKVQLRFLCQRESIPISRAWIVTETTWDQLDSLDLPASSYASVLVHPQAVNGKTQRMFSRAAFASASFVLGAAKDYWVRHAIVKEILPSDLTGVAIQNGERVLIEVAKGHFIPKGVVDTCIYEVLNGEVRLVREQTQSWYFDIDLGTGEATKHEWGGLPSLTPKQIGTITSFCDKLQLHSGDYLEFGVGADEEVFLIDSQSGTDNVAGFAANEQVLSLGQSQGQLFYIAANDADATETHFLDFASGQNRGSATQCPVIIASRRPELGLLTEFARLSDLGMHVVGAIFEIYSPLCHLAVLLREWGIPAVVVPSFISRDIPAGITIRVVATTGGGHAEVLD